MPDPETRRPEGDADAPLDARRAQARICSVARTLEVVGEKWALLAVREAFLGVRRFDEIVRRTGAPRDTMAARLRTLVDAGILERRRYSEHPPRYEYRLTPAGIELYPVIISLLHWGDDHLAGPEGPPMELLHHGDHRLAPELSCAVCGEAVDPRTVRPLRSGPPAGPGVHHHPATGTSSTAV